MKTIKIWTLRAVAAALTLGVMVATAVAAEATAADPFLNWPDDVATGWETGWTVPEGTLPPPAAAPGFDLGPAYKTSFRISVEEDVPGAFWYEYRHQAGRYPEGGVGERISGTATATGLRQNTVYFVQVRACNGGGCSDWSEASEAASISTLKHRDGTIAHPWETGRWVTMGDWTITAVEFFRGDDAWRLLRAENQFNDPPLRGNEYYLVWMNVIYDGTGQESMFGFQFLGVSDDGTISDRCGAVVIPQELDTGSYIAGSRKSGNVCIEGSAARPLNLLIQNSWIDEGRGFEVMEMEDDHRCTLRGLDFDCPPLEQ